MKWKYVLITIVLLAVGIPAGMYLSAIDWQHTHRKQVAALPLFSPNSPDGQYRLQANGMEFHIRVAGLHHTGPCIVFLHGFPESSLMWEPLMQQAAAAGYRVLAFDQRGYSPQARPKTLSAYTLQSLSTDVLAVAKAVGFTKVHLVGHDWGALIAWYTAMEQPQFLHSLSTLSIPHPAVFFDAVLHDPEQAQRSAYVTFFQKPLLPEFLMTYRGQRTLRQLLSNQAPHLQQEYLSIQAEWGAFTAALNYYRAMDVAQYAQLRGPVRVPTLFLWGRTDPVLAAGIVPRQKPFIAAPYTELGLAAGHALLQDAPLAVSSAILTHINQHP